MLEINDSFVKTLEKRCTRYLAPGSVFEIHNIDIDFIEGIWYTFTIAWGPADGNNWHSDEIIVEDKEANIDFISGMVAQLVYMNERGDC